MSGLRERKKARTRAQILTAARRAIEEQGFAATTIEGIAAAAEVAAGSVYNYFGSKNALIAALWWDVARETLAAADERVRRASGGAAQCVELLTSFVEAAELFEPPVLREILISAFAAPPAELARDSSASTRRSWRAWSPCSTSFSVRATSARTWTSTRPRRCSTERP